MNLTRDWPSRQQVQRLLELQLERQLTIIGNLSADQLNHTHPRLAPPSTLSAWILHALHDEAKHSGEMYLLWKMCKARQADE